MLARRLRPEQGVVVFDLGVNDDPAQPGALASDLAAARRAAGKRCMVVATLERPALNGVNVDGLNQAVESFAARTPERAAGGLAGRREGPARAAERGRRAPHAAGYALRGRLVAEGVQACIAGRRSKREARPSRSPPHDSARCRGGRCF